MASIQHLSSVSSLHADAELAMAAASCVSGTALQAGAHAPLFALAGANGACVTLESLLDAGPVVLNFFRGVWCSDGARSLIEFAAVAPALASLGASAVVIGPGGQLATRYRRTPGVTVLHDADMQVARSFGIAFNLPNSLRALYQRLGYQAPEVQEDAGSWLVPVPAVYLLDREGVIVLAAVERDYRKRFEVAPLLDALKAIRFNNKKYRV